MARWQWLAACGRVVGLQGGGRVTEEGLTGEWDGSVQQLCRRISLPHSTDIRGQYLHVYHNSVFYGTTQFILSLHISFRKYVYGLTSGCPYMESHVCLYSQIHTLVRISVNGSSHKRRRTRRRKRRKRERKKRKEGKKKS